MTSKEKLKVLTELCDDCFEMLRNIAHRSMNEQISPDHGEGIGPERWTADGDAFCGKCEPLIQTLTELDA